MSKAGIGGTGPRCDLFRPRRVSDSMYDLDAWSDAVDTIGTETWTDMSHGAAHAGVSKQDCTLAPIDARTFAPNQVRASSPASRLENGHNGQGDANYAHPDAKAPRNHAGSSEDILKTRPVDDACSEKALPTGHYSDGLSSSDVVADNSSLRTLFEVHENVWIGRPCLSTSTSESSLDLDLRYQDVEDEGLRRSAAEHGTSQLDGGHNAGNASTLNDAITFADESGQERPLNTESADIVAKINLRRRQVIEVPQIAAQWGHVTCISSRPAPMASAGLKATA
jgi:hypothetical protein